MPKHDRRNASTFGGLKYTPDAEQRENLGRFISGVKVILIIMTAVGLGLVAWRWHFHKGLEYKTTHIGLRDDNSAKCRAALGPHRLNDDDDNDDYCIVAEYYGDINYWWMAFSWVLVTLVGLVLTSLDLMTQHQNVSGRITVDSKRGLYSRYLGIGGVVRNLGYYDADYHFWLCRIFTDFYIGFSIPLNIGGLDIIYAIFGGFLLSAYAIFGFFREVAHASHTFEDSADSMWWHRFMARPWAHLPQLAVFLGYFVTLFCGPYLEFVEHNDLRTVVAWSFWLPFVYYLVEQVVPVVWTLYRSRIGREGDVDLHLMRKWIVALHWITYFLFFVGGMALVPGWMMQNFREAI